MEIKKILSALLISLCAMPQMRAEQVTATSPSAADNIDITLSKLTEAADFSGTLNGRYGKPSNWIVENYSMSNYRDGLDSGSGTNGLSLQVWGDDASEYESEGDARIYQSVELEAGTYYFGACYRSCQDMQGYLFVSTTLSSTADIPTSSIVCHPLSDITSMGNTMYGVTFTLTKKQTVNLGWQADLSAGGYREVHVRSVRLLRYSGVIDLTTDQLIESTNFSATGILASSRFGKLASPWITTSNLFNQNGGKGGFDNLNDPNMGCVSVEKWSWGASITNGKIYQTSKAELPAGTYRLQVTAKWGNNMNSDVCQLRVVKGNDFPDYVENDPLVLASQALGEILNVENQGMCEFTLSEASNITLGLLINLQEWSVENAFRMTDLRLMKNDGAGNYSDVTDSYLENTKETIQRGDLARYGKPVYWTTENYRIDCGESGVREGIDALTGYNNLNLLVWGDDRTGMTDSRVYRKVHLDAGTYYFGASYECIDRMGNAYVFATKDLVSTTDMETSDNTLAYLKLNEIKNFGADDHSRDEMYPIMFTLAEESDVYLGWQADFTQGGDEQQFRAFAVKLAKVKDIITLDENDETIPLTSPWADVTMTRTLKANNWNSFCVPFDMDIPDGWEVKEFTSSVKNGDNITAIFTEATEISAGVPYIVRPAEAVTEINVENVAVNPTLIPVSDENLTMIGNMKKEFVPEGSYFINNSKFYLADQANYVTSKGFRAWFTPITSSPIKNLNFVVDGEATDINSIENEELTIENGIVYDLQGRRVSRLTKGMYIINGKKVFVK